jgi:4-amino-4-deoxy-L-arabinose transferase-like glycosyltransferase
MSKINNFRKKLYYIAISILLCGTLLEIFFRLISSNNGRLVSFGDNQDNIILPLFDLFLYQIVILCLAALVAPILPDLVRHRVSGLFKFKPIIFLILVFSFILITTNLISYFVLEHFPRDVDNIARLFQSHTFATGHVYVDPPPIPEAFSVPAVLVKDGKMYSKYEPGSSFVYAIWRRVLGIQWGVNPFLGAIILVILYRILKTWYDERLVRLTLILICLSPFFLFMSAEFHSHLPCLFFIVVFILFLILGSQKKKWYYFLLSGFCLGMAFTVRTYTPFLVSLPFIVWFCIQNRFKGIFKRLLFFSIGFIFPLSALLYYNYVLTGHPLNIPFLVANPQEKVGFGYSGHTLLKGIINTKEMVQLLNLNLFGWPCSLFFVVLFILIGKKHRWDILLLASVLCLIIGYGFYYWIDFSFGPRFYFEMLPFIVLLAARGMVSFPEYLHKIGFKSISKDKLMNFVICVVVFSFMFSFIFYMGPIIKMYHRDYNNIVNTKVASLARSNQIANALVFMKDPEGFNTYASGFLANDLDFHGDVVYVRDRGEEANREVMRFYPDRTYYQFEFNIENREGKFTKLGRTPSTK